MLYQTPTTAGTGDKNIIILKYIFEIYDGMRKKKRICFNKSLDSRRPNLENILLALLSEWCSLIGNECEAPGKQEKKNSQRN